MRSPRVALAVLFVGIVATAQTQPDRQPASAGAAISAPVGEFTTSFVRQQCIEFTKVKRGEKPDDLRDCRVSDFGEFGIVDEVHYHYAIYCLIPNYAPDKVECDDGSSNAAYYRSQGLVIFTGDSLGLRVRVFLERVERQLGILQYDPPEIVRNAAGTILYLPIKVDGTGHESVSEYFLRVAGDWPPIEAQDWLKDLSRHLPAGLGIWKGVWPNLRTMQTVASLYRNTDANCCPTGGTARIRFSIRSTRFVLDSVVFERPK